MKNSRKWFFAFEAVLAVLVAVLAFVMFLERNGEDLPKVSVIVQNSDDNRWAAFKYGLKMAAADQNIELYAAGTGGTMTPEEEIEIINREIKYGADAVIVQPVVGDGVEAAIKKAGKKVPVVFVEGAASDGPQECTQPVVQPDHYAMGQTLAEELLKDFNHNITGKRIGIVMETAETEPAAACRKGLEDGLQNTGAIFCWTFAGAVSHDGKNRLEEKPEADIVIALDDDSLTAAGECAAAGNLHGALVYGIGSSTEAVYYLDTGNVECLAVPDEFSMGYQSLSEAARYLRRSHYKMKGSLVSHTVIRREELFSEENQELLFTMSQQE